MADEPHEPEEKEKIEAEGPEGHPEPAEKPEPHPSEPSPKQEPSPDQPSKKGFKKFLATKKGKILVAIAAVVVLAAALLALPATRYGILGLVIHKDMDVTVVDSKTGKPVTDAAVSVPGFTAKTDNNGKATLSKVPVGEYQLSVQKQYYKSYSGAATVPVLSASHAGTIKLEATGRQVPVTVVDKISGKPLEKVKISASNTTGITDAKGQVTLVVPANDTTEKATLTLDGYNQLSANITVTEQADPKNTFAMTASGKVYFLSKRTGKISVYKSDLDGNNQQLVLAGTGQEEEGGTVLLATKDWKYLVLLAKRDSSLPKLYLINTSNDQLTTIDEGNAQFSLSGWEGHTFIYKVQRQAINPWQPKQYALKSFAAETGKINILDETDAKGQPSGYLSEYYESIYLIDSQNVVIYVTNWSGYYFGPGQPTIVSIQPDGTNKKVLTTFDQNITTPQSVLYKPAAIYFRVVQNGLKYYEYEDGKLTENSSVKDSAFFGQFYPTYLLSPSGNQTFWYEPRDGKNTLFIGDKNGENGKEVASGSEFTPYGWFTDNDLLVSKNSSELYIVPATSQDFSKALKITDYHKPNYLYLGYGGGYGGGF